MERWRVAVCDPGKNDGARLFLRNRSETIVTVNRRLKFDPTFVFDGLERRSFPSRYAEGLERIHFSILPSAGGYYEDGRIWVDVSPVGTSWVFENIIHEIGHHVDEQEGISSLMHGLPVGRRRFYLGERLSKNSHEEYFAIGFQKFYSDDPRDKERLRQRNPEMYRLIRKLHSEYHRKG